jgi:hypothetical protein
MRNKTMVFMEHQAEEWPLPYGLGLMDKSETASPVELKFDEAAIRFLSEPAFVLHDVGHLL